MEIRRYKIEDTEEISALVCRNFIEVNKSLNEEGHYRMEKYRR